MAHLENSLREYHSLLLKPKEKVTNNYISTVWGNFSSSIKVNSDSITLIQDDLIDEIMILFLNFWYSLELAPTMKGTLATIIKLSNQLHSYQTTGTFTKRSLENFRIKLESERNDLIGFEKHIDEDMVVQGLNIIKSRLQSTDLLLVSLEEELSRISESLLPIRSRLIEIKHELSGLLSRKNPHAFSLVEVQLIQSELQEIDSARIDGKYVSNKDGSIVIGQAAVIDLMESCFEDVHELLGSKDPVGGENPLRSIYEELIDLRVKLEAHLLSYVSPINMKSEELIPFQVRLGLIDNMRKDGMFLAEDGSCPPGQAILHFLMHKCYRLVHKLQMKIEPVHESLMPFYSQLETLQRLLWKLKKWNIQMTLEEMVPYQIKLSSIVKQSQQSRCLDEDGGIPAGQAVLSGMIEKCHRLIDLVATNP